MVPRGKDPPLRAVVRALASELRRLFLDWLSDKPYAE